MSKKELDDIKIRVSAMEVERSSFISHWKELSDYIEPRRGRFFVTDRNKGERRHNLIVNSRGGQALRTYQSGMFAGIMSPARPWFKLETLNTDLMKSTDAKKWLYQAETLMRSVMLDSNLYSMAPVALGEHGLFGTAAMSQLDDFESVCRFYTHTAGSYYIAQNDRLQVDTFAIKRERTVRQMVSEFGLDKVSSMVKNLHEKGQMDTWVPVTQFISPNPKFTPDGTNLEMPFMSKWYEENSNEGRYLKEGGFEEFPVHVARYALTAEDIYSTNSPGMVSLGDIKSIQVMEKRKAQAVEKMLNPPLKGPPTLRDSPVSSLPGGLTLYDGDGQKEGLSTIYQIQPQINEMRMEIEATERRINEAYFVDLFLAITNMGGVQPRNQLELNQRNEERLLMIGPSLERLQQDFLGSIVERTFNQIMRANILPPPPAELGAQAINIRFISALAQAQRAHEVGTIERSTAFATQLAGIDPQVLDKFNADEALERYIQLTGGNPSLVVPDADVQEMRQERAEAQKAQAEAMNQQKQSQAGLNMSGAAKNMSEMGGADAE
jgi:hypothetical protein|tara:strand:- start:3331 stop:4980 length:1650 start_codon:yes stop_codon:yes gene_type:complete